MSVDEPHPTPRPTDPLTAKDAVRLFTSIDTLSKRLESELQLIRGSITNLQGNIIKLSDTLSRIEAGLADSRINRLEIELREAELEREKAEADLRKAEEKVGIKQGIKDKTIDTQEKIEKFAGAALLGMEQKRQQERAARVDDLKWTIYKTAVTWGTVGLLALITTGVIFIIRLYFASQGNP